MGEGRDRARSKTARVIETATASGARFAAALAGARHVGAWGIPGIARRAALTPPITGDGVFRRVAARSMAPRAAVVHLPGPAVVGAPA